MNKRFTALIFTAIVSLLVVAIFLGFLSSIGNPISWALVVLLLLVNFVYQTQPQSKKITWKNEYSVGVLSLDQDHKKLISLLNQFTTAYDYAMSEEFEQKALKELIDYTKYHFAREEKLMLENNYPDFDAHQQQHQAMIIEVQHFVNLYNEKGHEVLGEVSDFLTQWLLNHINGTDKQYTQHLNDCGVK